MITAKSRSLPRISKAFPPEPAVTVSNSSSMNRRPNDLRMFSSSSTNSTLTDISRLPARQRDDSLLVVTLHYCTHHFQHLAVDPERIGRCPPLLQRIHEFVHFRRKRPSPSVAWESLP